ncbi:MAG: hypothetical protein H7Y41_04580 [Hyphomonadaceae bacterium]|nr:hypothetical protein [Clostridia bacterium]
MSQTVVGVFDSYQNAENAARQVKDQGLRTDDISIIAKDDQKNNGDNDDASARNADMTNDNMSGGAVTGGVLGGVAGLLLGMGTIAIPGLGVIAAAGPIAGLLSGAITGGVVGGLVDLGIPEEESKRYERDVKSGKILWSMKTESSNTSRVQDILKSNGAYEVKVYQ